MYFSNEIFRKLVYKLIYNKTKKSSSLDLLYGLFLKLNNIDPKKICILATTTKTGTHFLRLMLAKYLELLLTENDTTDESLIDKYFPNSWHSSYTFGKEFQKPNLRELKGLYLQDIPRSHMPLKKSWYGSKVIHTFRNPLDHSVISFFTKHKLENINRFESPYHLFLETYQSTILEYESFLENNNQDNVLRISFESLITSPHVSLISIINFLGINYDHNQLKKSVNYAMSFDLARVGAFEKWQRSGIINNNSKKYLNDFLEALEKNKCPNGINSYKYYFTRKEQKHCIKLIKANSSSMFRLYFPESQYKN